MQGRVDSVRARRKRLAIALLPVLIAGCVLAVWQTKALIDDGQWDRLLPISAYPEALGVLSLRREDADLMRSLINENGLAEGRLPVVDRLLKIQDWLGEQVQIAEVDLTNRYSSELWAKVQSGHGLACGGMALLFRDLVAVQGFPARLVQLYRADTEPDDTHVIVEVSLEGLGWVAFDPTFNLTFRDDHGRLLGVREVRQRMAANPREPVHPTYHGDRAYPAKLETYYLEWRALFANAYTYGYCRDCALWTKLPPFRYWSGPRRYLIGDGLGPLARTHNRMYFWNTVVMPLLLLWLSAAVLWLAVMAGKRN